MAVAEAAMFPSTAADCFLASPVAVPYGVPVVVAMAEPEAGSQEPWVPD